MQIVQPEALSRLEEVTHKSNKKPPNGAPTTSAPTAAITIGSMLDFLGMSRSSSPSAIGFLAFVEHLHGSSALDTVGLEHELDPTLPTFLPLNRIETARTVGRE